MTIRILLVDDHSVVREALRACLRRDTEFEVVGEAENGAEAIEMARQLRPGVVVMDLNMPYMDGIQATSMIFQEMPETNVVILTSSLTGNSVWRALRAGARSYILKDMHAAQMSATIKAAAAGHMLLSSQVSSTLIEEMRALENAK